MSSDSLAAAAPRLAAADGLTGRIAGPLADRHAPELLGGIGLVIFGVGLGALAFLPAQASVADIVWRTAVCGAGLVALCFHLAPSWAPTLALWLGCAFALAGSAASVLRLLPALR